jgi:hypothetical protein
MDVIARTLYLKDTEQDRSRLAKIERFAKMHKIDLCDYDCYDYIWNILEISEKSEVEMNDVCCLLEYNPYLHSYNPFDSFMPVDKIIKLLCNTQWDSDDIRYLFKYTLFSEKEAQIVKGYMTDENSKLESCITLLEILVENNIVIFFDQRWNIHTNNEEFKRRIRHCGIRLGDDQIVHSLKELTVLTIKKHLPKTAHWGDCIKDYLPDKLANECMDKILCKCFM